MVGVECITTAIGTDTNDDVYAATTIVNLNNKFIPSPRNDNERIVRMKKGEKVQRFVIKLLGHGHRLAACYAKGRV